MLRRGLGVNLIEREVLLLGRARCGGCIGVARGSSRGGFNGYTSGGGGIDDGSLKTSGDGAGVLGGGWSYTKGCNGAMSATPFATMLMLYSPTCTEVVDALDDAEGGAMVGISALVVDGVEDGLDVRYDV